MNTAWHADDTLLAQYLRGDAGPLRGASLEQHLTHCAPCRARIGTLVETPPLELVWSRICEQAQAPAATLIERLLTRLGVSEPDALLVAVACSGLGHIHRGIEAWASDLAHGLREAEVDVTLFGGAAAAGVTPVSCFKRTDPGNARLTGLFRNLGGWRYGLGSPYEVEQTSFSLSLWPKIRRDFDILHVQKTNDIS